jgi:hypothetical protein
MGRENVPRNVVLVNDAIMNEAEDRQELLVSFRLCGGSRASCETGKAVSLAF